MQKELLDILQKELAPKYRIEIGKRLLYKSMVRADGKEERRKFQTDVLVSNEKQVPLVVIETKTRGFNTDSILAYTAKASKHKQVFPHVRYGYVALSDRNKIDRKFFWHNECFDFAAAIRGLDELNDLVGIMKDQVESAEILLDILHSDRIVTRFSNTVRITEPTT